MPRPARRTVVAITSLIGATVLWAGNYIVGAAAVVAMDPVSLALLRWLIAVVPLFVIAQLVERPRWRDLLKAWRAILVLAGFGLLGYNLFLYAALEHTDALSASLVNAFNPALISIAAALVLRERLRATGVAGILVALAGVLVVLSGGDPGSLFRGGFGTGELLMLGAILAWTGYTIAGRLVTGIPPIASTACQAVVSIVVLAPVAAFRGGPTLPEGGQVWLALLFIGLFPSVLSYLLWNRALTVIPPARAGVFLNLITVFTAAFTVLAGHPFTVAQLVGGAIVIAGVALANERAFRRPAATTAE
ncbi:DMT family transporter [Herbiconiux sp. YIM B11900]|uniref:DMT family transporter n=1 Tax=Herbiconiux sp. YIM B11900 TaxID=3404131 RepID=UPI003F85E1D2